MADIFLVKERLKFTLKLLAVGIAAGAAASWYFHGQIEYPEDRSRFLLTVLVTCALALGFIGTLVFYAAARQVVNPAHNVTDRIDSVPWWFVRIFLLLLMIAAGGFALHRFSAEAENEFTLLKKSNLDALEQRIAANTALLDKKDLKTGLTLAQIAFSENNPAAVRLLLKQGSDPTKLDPQGRSPVILAIENEAMLSVLLEQGVNPEMPDADGLAPLFHAVGRKQINTVELLIDAGAKVDVRDKGYRTPLMTAVESDDLKMAAVLLEAGAGVNEFDQRGDTPLHRATRRQNEQCVRLLLGKGADPKIFNFSHFTPLHIAASDGKNELVKILAEKTDSVDLRDEKDRAPLDYTLAESHFETAELLIELGADINRIRIDGETLLHELLAAKSYQAARFLIDQGADVHIENTRGETAYEFIRRKQLSGLLEMIQKRDNPEAAATNTVEQAEAENTLTE